MVEHLAWPAAFVLVFVFFALLFRQPITAFFGRVSRLKYAGLEAGTTPTEQQLQAAPATQQWAPIFNQDLVREASVEINRAIVGDPNREARLLEVAAAGLIAFRFDGFYQRIIRSGVKPLAARANTSAIPLQLRR